MKRFKGSSRSGREFVDAGQDGPTFRFTYVHTTYGDDLKIETLDEHEDYFTVFEGMVYYDGMFYGDWSVYSEDSPDAPNECETFDQKKARLPDKYRAKYVGLEINRELVLSTAHISERCNDAIVGTEPGDDPDGVPTANSIRANID